MSVILKFARVDMNRQSDTEKQAAEESAVEAKDITAVSAAQNLNAAPLAQPIDETEPESFLVSERANMQLQPPEMIFDDLWPARTIGLFTGDGGIGKTHFTLQLLLAIASGGAITGTPFTASKALPVVYITQEDEGNFILDEFQTQEPSLISNTTLGGMIRIVSTTFQGNTLFLRNPTSRDYLISQLTDGCVFVLDSWSTFLQSNENDNTELLKEIGYLKEVMKARKASCLLIHHRPKKNPQSGIQSAFRGGTALPNSCRFHIMIEKSGAKAKLTFEKVSRGKAPDSLDMIFDDEKRLFVTHQRDRYIVAFQPNEKLTTTVVINRLGKNPLDIGERKTVVDALGYRVKKALGITKVQDQKPGQDAVWQRVI